MEKHPMLRVVTPHHRQQPGCQVLSPISGLSFLPRLSGSGSACSVGCISKLREISLTLLLGPILDPTEFPSRFYAHTKGTQSLGHEGGLIAMLLVVWAASFGLDERGLPSDSHSNADIPTFVHTKDEADAFDNRKFKDGVQDMKWREKKDKTDTMLREVLELIDFHGVMRRPTLDGVRALLLILPLLEGSNLSSIEVLVLTLF